ncbi:MAG: hypothetical protein ACLFMM_02145 [Methanohalobium sp.]|uniref:hypothetical protein n=1 Tax=Methanohalobium sp. TaxID=2837493 RepID=UPI0039783D11
MKKMMLTKDKTIPTMVRYFSLPWFISAIFIPESNSTSAVESRVNVIITSIFSE